MLYRVSLLKNSKKVVLKSTNLAIKAYWGLPKLWAKEARLLYVVLILEAWKMQHRRGHGVSFLGFRVALWNVCLNQSPNNEVLRENCLKLQNWSPSKPGIMMGAFRKKTQGISEMEASLVCIVNSRQAELHRETLSRKTKQQRHHKHNTKWSLSYTGDTSTLEMLK